MCSKVMQEVVCLVDSVSVHQILLSQTATFKGRGSMRTRTDKVPTR
jgi:hypothetical protein